MVLSIIIVNYNTAEYVRGCLRSIFKLLDLNDIEVLIADNNSPDREVEKLAIEFPEAKFIFNSRNEGFGSGCNSAAEISKGEYVLFLNPDTKLLDNSILNLVEILKADDEAGIVSGLLVNENGEPIYCFNEFPDLKWEFYQTIGTGYERAIEDLLNRDEIRNGRKFEVDWFHGAFLLMRKSDFQRVGGFDGKYFMYYEDVELCHDFKEILGLKNYCFPNVRISHSTQSSLKSESIDNIRNFHMHRGKILFTENYGFVYRNSFRLLGIANILLRIPIVMFWKKYSKHRKEKFRQLTNILRLYLSKDYLRSSKFEYIKV